MARIKPKLLILLIRLGGKKLKSFATEEDEADEKDEKIKNMV